MVTRRRFAAVLVGATALACICLPGTALAGTYTWSLPGDFSLSGANPDHGPYGDAPWTYLDRSGAGAMARLDSFKADVQGGLAGWTDSGDTSALVATNPQSDPVIGGANKEDTFQPGQMVLEPTPNHAVAIGWASPVAATVSVSATIASDETADPAGSACASLGWDTWSLDLNGSPLEGHGGTVPDAAHGPVTISATVPVAPGDRLELVVAAGDAVTADPGCAPVGVTLAVRAPGSAPAPALAEPRSGTVIGDGEPRFAGSAGAAFGDQGTVTVRVYRGTRVDSASLAETLSGHRDGSGFSFAPDPFLYNGTYTVQAEQDDLVGDRGYSAPVTFEVLDPLPAITLAPLGKLLRTDRPTFIGTGGTLDGDSSEIDVFIWRGTRARGYPVRHLLAPLGANGRWRLRVATALQDGRYVAIAAQNSPAGLIGSQPVRFEIASHPRARRHRLRR